MATKKCPNGHQYDGNIYGDNCPFCPTSFGEGKTQVMGGATRPTQPLNENGYQSTGPTQPWEEAPAAGGKTIIRDANGNIIGGDNKGKLLAGMLVSFTNNQRGKSYDIYAGSNKIGRSAICDISIPEDEELSSEHLEIQYIADEQEYIAYNLSDTHFAYIQGQKCYKHQPYTLHDKDVIVIGKTKLQFIALSSNF
ncbi:MAG: FHA domain-containing protein [Bacteroidales bacterium]|nr:FHA domain-containing protein [Bacteroidales bacterium]